MVTCQCHFFTVICIKPTHFNGDDDTFYGPFVEVIHMHWDALFNHPLYVAEYFLNPACRYQPDFNAPPETIWGLNKCISRIESDNMKRISVRAQILEFVLSIQKLTSAQN